MRQLGVLGRSAELCDARRALAARQRVVFSGPAGVGKSTVVQVLADEAVADGAMHQRVVGREATRVIPFGAFGRLLGDAPPHLAATNIADALIERSLGTKQKTSESARRGRPPPLLVVEDLHALDEASLGVVQQLVHDGRIDVLLSVRAEEALTGPVSSLCADPTIVRIDLQPLRRDDAERLVELFVGGPVESATRMQLAQVSGGNPLFLRELVLGSMAAGALVKGDSAWRFNARLAGTPALEELILSRYSTLGEHEREAIEILACAGGLPMTMVEHLVPLDMLERLERECSITIGPGPDGPRSVSLSHPLHTEVINHRIPALTRLRLSRQLAAVANGLPPETVDELRLALWERDGGIDLTPDRMMMAARVALDRNDTTLAGEFAEAILGRWPSFDAFAIAAWARSERGDHQGAHDLAASALEALEAPWERAAMVLRMAEERWWGEDVCSDGRSAREVLASGRASLPAGPWQDALVAQDLVFHVLDGDVDHVLSRSSPFGRHDDPRVAAVGGLAESLALTFADRTEHAVEIARRTRASTTRATAFYGDPDVHVLAEVLALMFGGELVRADELITTVHEHAVTRPGLQARGWAAAVRAFVLLFRGRFDDASRLASEAHDLWVATGSLRISRWAIIAVAQAAIEQGRLDEARAALAQLRATPADRFALFEPLTDRADALIDVRAGSVARGVRSLRAAFDRAAATRRLALAAVIANDLTRSGALSAARECFDQLPSGGALTEAFRSFAVAVDAGNLDPLAEIGERFSAMGADLHAAEAFNRAALLASRAGRNRESRHFAELAEHRSASCQRISYLPIAQRAVHPTGLTRREQEIARLAAEGRSNRQIADLLVLSERTVENHLYRVFGKLGLSTRTELAAALEDSW